MGTVGLDGLLGLAIEQSVAQQIDLFFKIDDVAFVDRVLSQHLRKHRVKRRAVCGNSARTDLCGGWQVTAIPTATVI